MKKTTTILTVMLIIGVITGILAGHTWQPLIAGLVAIFTAILWIGEMEADGTLN